MQTMGTLRYADPGIKLSPGNPSRALQACKMGSMRTLRTLFGREVLEASSTPETGPNLSDLDFMHMELSTTALILDVAAEQPPQLRSRGKYVLQPDRT